MTVGGASSEPTGPAVIPEYLPGEGDCVIHDTDGVLSIEWRGDESMRWVRVSRPLIEQWVKDVNENRRLRVAAGILQTDEDLATLVDALTLAASRPGHRLVAYRKRASALLAKVQAAAADERDAQ